MAGIALEALYRAGGSSSKRQDASLVHTTQHAEPSFSTPRTITDQFSKHANDFLRFIVLLQQFQIGSASPRLLSTGDSVDGRTNIESTGAIGSGGQYVVDRYYENQRFPNVPGLKPETSIVYKRLHRSEAGLSSDRASTLESQTLSSFVREIRVLGKFKAHKDIVNLVGVAWELSDGELRPVLALEYAQHNSLPKFWHSNITSLTFREKQDLCYDIANGMESLHNAGLIWGDCKPENVLIFQDPHNPSGWKAKLNDFGACVIETNVSSGFVAYSSPWTAPESAKANTFETLRLAEVYAYGMLFWAVHLSGRQFWRILWDDADAVASDISDAGAVDCREIVSADEVEQLKRHRVLSNKAISVLHAYTKALTMSGHLPTAPAAETALVELVIQQTMTEDVSRRWRDMTTILQNIRPGKPPPLSIYGDSLDDSRLQSPSKTWISFGDPADLDLEQSITSFGPTTDLTEVAQAIFERLIEYSSAARSAQGFFKCSVCCTIGFGTAPDLNRALQFMHRSAKLGHDPAKGLYFTLRDLREPDRDPFDPDNDDTSVKDEDEDLLVFDDFGQTDDEHASGFNSRQKVSNTEDQSWIWQAVVQGSNHAAAVLQRHDHSLYVMALEEYRDRRTWVDYMDQDSCPLTVAAGRGDVAKLTELLDDSKKNIERKTSDGETALLIAARRGHLSAVLTLIECGASTDVVDNFGVTVLHWLISFNKNQIRQLKPHLVASQSSSISRKNICISEHYSGTLEHGAPLDWAVDVRNTAAVRALLDLGSDPSLQSGTRPSALCRAAGRHDHEILSLLITASVWGTSITSRLDQNGASCISYVLRPIFLFERQLIYEDTSSGSNGLTKLLQLLIRSEADVNVVNDIGESTLYCAAKWLDVVSVETICLALGGSVECDKQITSSCGPNSWWPLRRALFNKDALVFETLLTHMSKSNRHQVANSISSDGLTILHELAFLPPDQGIDHANHLLQLPRPIWRRLIHRRLGEYQKRSALTPFQLAALCQRFDLADFLVAHGANPLDGVDKARFLGYLISYQLLDSYQTSTFLCAILDDPTVNSMRRFPPPSSMQPCVFYLLKNEIQWWAQAIPTSNWSLLDDSEDQIYKIDEDVRHDPMIAKRPGISAVVRDIMGDTREAEGRTIRETGFSGVLDANEAGFGVRNLHARAFGSFLIKYRRNGPMEQQYGHKYVTALELAFDVVVSKKDNNGDDDADDDKLPLRESEQIFLTVLDHFKHRMYCNYPYVIFLPYFGSTFFDHLRRRETILHRAVRARRFRIVQKLLAAGADSRMANINWQTPLRLAMLLKRGHDPDLPYNHGSFVQRFFPSSPARVTETTPESPDGDRILALLEADAAAAAEPWRLWRSWSPARALLEVRWPWDEYESDDLGARFAIFYLTILSLILCILLLLTGVLGFVPRLLYAIGDSLDEVFESLIPFMECYKECTANGSDPRVLCTSMQFKPAAKLAYDVTGSWQMSAFTNYTIAFIDSFDLCYDPSKSPPPTNGTSDSTEIMPGCDLDLMDTTWTDGNQTRLEEELRKLVEKKAKCSCSWGGKPSYEYVGR